MANRALEGVRILDFGMFAAGPWATMVLADMGAEVIKIEAPRRPDPLRVHGREIWPNNDPGKHPWNRAGIINERNRNKLGLTLDLTTPQGKGLFRRLVKISDVVSENFSVRVMKNLGFDYPVLKEINPQIIMLSLASQGLTGPEKDYVSFGPVLEHTSGIASIMGYPDTVPNFSSVAFPDAMAGLLGGGLILSALHYRSRTGRGLHIDLSQREFATNTIGPAILDYSMNRRDPQRWGNRHPSQAPHNLYPCLGEDAWIAISVASDEEWQHLCQVMGRPDLAHDPRFGDTVTRWKHQEELDSLLAGWTREQDHRELTAKLQAVGVAAGAVLNVAEFMEDPQVKARGFFEEDHHPEAGSYPLRGRAMHLSKTPGSIYRPAPLLGEHNRYILKELLGLEEAEIASLEAQSIIGDAPVGEIV